MPINVSFLQELLGSIAEQSRNYLPSALVGGRRPGIDELARALLSGKGEASGVAIAREIVERYRVLKPEERLAFFRFLLDGIQPDQETVARTATSYLAAPSEATMLALQRAVESPRQEFFRRLNRAPGATAEIVGMRQELLRLERDDKRFGIVDADLEHLLASWFNRGFLVLRRIDWQTPAAILDKIIRYEAVHEIQGWDDLKRRLDPTDRRCFGFFHPSLVDDPIIFVEVALVNETPATIDSVLKEQPKAQQAKTEPTTAVFYSISNCQPGLRGISFGNFLIKQVAEDLLKENPRLKTFVTLSPVPGFRRWLDRHMADTGSKLLTDADRAALAPLAKPTWHRDAAAAGKVKAVLLALAAHYFLKSKTDENRPVDPVARFHLGNGARLERLNWLGDTSEKGLREAYGLMVNYLYDLDEIETNHEAYANEGVVAASKTVRGTLRSSTAPQTDSVGGGTQKLPAVTARLLPPAKSR